MCKTGKDIENQQVPQCLRLFLATSDWGNVISEPCNFDHLTAYNSLAAQTLPQDLLLGHNKSASPRNEYGKYMLRTYKQVYIEWKLFIIQMIDWYLLSSCIGVNSLLIKTSINQIRDLHKLQFILYYNSYTIQYHWYILIHNDVFFMKWESRTKITITLRNYLDHSDKRGVFTFNSIRWLDRRK